MRARANASLLSPLYLSMFCFSFSIPVGQLGTEDVLSRVCLTPLPLDFLVSSNKAPLCVRKIRFTRDFGGNRKCKCLIIAGSPPTALHKGASLVKRSGRRSSGVGHSQPVASFGNMWPRDHQPDLRSPSAWPYYAWTNSIIRD
jgi:hypothetical protein